MKRIKIISGSIVIFLMSITRAFAQDAPPEMGEALRENGKIYVVITVIGIIFTGIISYLIYLDRKISQLEKNK